MAAAVFFASAPVHSVELNILVFGDDVLSSCGAISVAATSAPRISTVQVSADLPASFSAAAHTSAACAGDNLWSRLGRHLIKSHNATSVRFVSIGKPGMVVDDLLHNSPVQASLYAFLRKAKHDNIHINYALWQHSEPNASNAYQYELGKLMRNVGLETQIGKWIVARNSGCAVRPNPILRDSQWHAGNNPLLSRYPGPDLDAFGMAYRADACHFNAYGQQKLAESWAVAIRRADRQDIVFQKESLLYWFR